MPVKTPDHPNVPGPVTRWPSKVPVQAIEPGSPPVVSTPETGDRVTPGDRWRETVIKQSAAVPPAWAWAGPAMSMGRKRATQPTMRTRRTLNTPHQIKENLMGRTLRFQYVLGYTAPRQRPLRSVFTPGKPDHEGIEQREQDEAGREPGRELVELVDDERHEQGHHPRVGPQLVAEHQRHEDDLRHPVRQEVDGAVEGGGTREMARRVDQVSGEEI